LPPPWIQRNGVNGPANGSNGHINGVNGYTNGIDKSGKIFIASISPQVRASLAATYGVTSDEAGNMISQLLSGPNGLASGGAHGSSFLWALDTNTLRAATLVLAAEEVAASIDDVQSSDRTEDAKPKRPILTSACPGWICYAEKTHPYILPHLSRLKSPQALAGTLLKSILSRKYGVSPDQIWHLAVMPCFDKKLEASRGELTSNSWSSDAEEAIAARDVDCVITARELITMAVSRGIRFSEMSRQPLRRSQRVPFPDPTIGTFLFPNSRRRQRAQVEHAAGSSGGYLWHILQRFRAKYPGSKIKVERGRNADVVEYLLVRPRESGATGSKDEILFKAARYYGFRNIQNLVRRLKPKAQSRLLAAAAAKGGARKPDGASSSSPFNKGSTASEYAYVEVMACPGGCTNGGGQVRAGEVEELRGVVLEGTTDVKKIGPQEQREWLGKVDEAYFSSSSTDSFANEEESGDDDEEMEGYGDAMDVDEEEGDVVDGISRRDVHRLLDYWAYVTDVDVQRLAFTTYRKVESDVGKQKGSDVERVASLAGTIGGGW
jgi:iron only hydrogenase large subunit-like protein